MLTFSDAHVPSSTLSVRAQVHGPAAGGDTDDLRLLSTSDTFINLRAHGGSFDVLRTKVSTAIRIT